jgi:hypothetical protein
VGASSDPTAMNPANKAEQSGAERVERRTGTKGNVGQNSTCRAQDRASVSQFLARIRQAAQAICRYSPEVGAVCGKAARTDLCGGRAERRVPTATPITTGVVVAEM